MAARSAHRHLRRRPPATGPPRPALSDSSARSAVKWSMDSAVLANWGKCGSHTIGRLKGVGMRSRSDGNIGSAGGPGAGQAGHLRRPRDRHRHPTGRVVTVALLIVTLTMIGSGVATASAAGPIGNCTIVTHPTAARFTNCPGSNLSGADLSGIDLSFADFSGADLSGANLSSSTMKHSNLSGATLTTCSFLMPPAGDFTCQIADLTGAELRFANLTGARLPGVNLSADDLSHAGSLGRALWSRPAYPRQSISPSVSSPT